MKRFKLYDPSQRERVSVLRSAVSEHLHKLEPDELLVVGIPAVIGPWEKCVVLILGSQMEDQFTTWLGQYGERIRGPVLNLPPLTAPFICMVVDNDFDPCTYELAPNASTELKGMFASLRALEAAAA
tara:strand:+ start:221882 stop:222262 length:381 start_codon:yes stop_codon:yes gene_type:complete